MGNPDLTREHGCGPVGGRGTAASPDNARISVNTPGPRGHNDPFSPNNPPEPDAGESGGILSKLIEFGIWHHDTNELYRTLTLEGLGFIVDAIGPTVNVYRGSKQDGLKEFGEAWDKHFNAMGQAHDEYSRKHEFQAMFPFDKMALFFAGTNPVKRKLFEYYVSCKGRNEGYQLSLEEVKLMPTYFDLFNPEKYSEKLIDPVAEAVKGKTVPVKTFVLGGNDALGSFTIHLDGVLKPAVGAPRGPTVCSYPGVTKPPCATAVPLMFEGSMVWEDKWDFDTKMAARLEGSTGRSGRIELAVAAVAALVDGVNFIAKSVSVPMTQYSGRFPVY